MPGSSVSLAARTQPAEPAPTMTWGPAGATSQNWQHLVVVAGHMVEPPKLATLLVETENPPGPHPSPQLASSSVDNARWESGGAICHPHCVCIHCPALPCRSHGHIGHSVCIQSPVLSGCLSRHSSFWATGSVSIQLRHWDERWFRGQAIRTQGNCMLFPV